MKTLTEAQENLLRTLGLPVAFEYLDDAEFLRIEDVLSCEIQMHGINEAGNGLNDHGELCRSCIVALPD